MDFDFYIKCKHCGKLCKYESIHMENCIVNWNDDNGLLSCYSCDTNYCKENFTMSQIKKDHLARCKKCVSIGIK